MIVAKSFVVLVLAVAVRAQAQNNPNGIGMRMHKRNGLTMKKRVAETVARLERRNPQIPDILFPPGNNGGGNNSSTTDTGTPITASPTTTTTTESTNTHSDQPPPSSSTTSTVFLPTTTTTPTTSQTPTTTSTSTSTSTTSTSTTSTSTTSTSTTPLVTAIIRTSQDTYSGIILASQTTYAPASTTDTSDSSTDTSTTSGGSFSQNKTAIAATGTIAGIVLLGALVFLGIWWKKKSQRGKMGDDMWDEASMKEFSHGPAMAGTPIVAPPAAARNIDLDDELGGAAGGLGRSNTKVLPSQSAYASGAAGLARSRSQHQQDTFDEPDELLAMPPVAHYERPRDSAYDIVPAAPPPSAYASAGGGQAGYSSQGYASGSGGYGTSGGLAPPLRKGDHTSFDHLGSDPFAGSGFVDANRESTYGPGQAGRGAGFATANAQGSVQGVGSQWPRGYNPYTGYSQGSQAPYGQPGYGYAS